MFQTDTLDASNVPGLCYKYWHCDTCVSDPCYKYYVSRLTLWYLQCFRPLLQVLNYYHNYVSRLTLWYLCFRPLLQVVCLQIDTVILVVFQTPVTSTVSPDWHFECDACVSDPCYKFQTPVTNNMSPDWHCDTCSVSDPCYKYCLQTDTDTCNVSDPCYMYCLQTDTDVSDPCYKYCLQTDTNICSVPDPCYK